MKQSPVVHFEMPYKDAKRVSSFYSKVFGWDMQILGPEMEGYILAGTTETKDMRPTTPGAINGGFFQSNDKNVAAVTIAVDSIDEAMKSVKDAGGEVLGEPVDIAGVGKYVGANDSEGNRISLLQPSGM